MASPVEVGEVLGGKFRVDRVLGTGGMGVVVAATNLHLDQRVALKFLLPDALKDEEIVARFSREARNAAKIQSEHVARVSDVGTLENGSPFLIMEYLEGKDLDQVLRSSGAVAIPEAVKYILQACEAVAEAHALGIIHRDLKPANLFLAERADGSLHIKVLDFGISKVTGSGPSPIDASLTKTSAVMGSPMYMSPEQLRSSRDVDARADIWALGVILYELLAGQGPFATGTIPEVCASILKEEPQPLREIRAEVPEGLEAVVVRCLRKDPAQRFANVAELCMALLSFGPPGSELSMERVSRVLQKAAAQSSASLERQLERVREGERETKPEVPRSLSDAEVGAAATQLAPESIKLPSAPPPPDTASPSSISSKDVAAGAASLTLNGRAKKGVSPKLLAAVVAGVLVAGGLAITFSGGSEEPASAGDVASPADTAAPLPDPLAADLHPTAPAATANRALSIPAKPTATAQEDPEVPEDVGGLATAKPSADPSPSAAPTATGAASAPTTKPQGAKPPASAAPLATASAAPSAKPSAAPSAKPSAAPSSAPTTEPAEPPEE